VGVNRIRFERLAFVADGADEIWSDGRYDAVVPVVDDVRLSELVGGDRFPGLHVKSVAPPSTQWLGRPTYEEDGYAVVLDGWCANAGCCGVFARIRLDGGVVRWSDFGGRGRPDMPDGLAFEFDRTEYESALAAAAIATPVEETLDLTD
jgi:hypothetical protein